MKQRYEVTYDEDDEPFIVTTFSPDDAVYEWCTYGDSNSWFVDGYPDGLRVKVKDSDGNNTMHVIHTDWSPDFIIFDD